MGVRTLVGEADGTTAAAAMYDSTSGWMIGPIWEADDAYEQIEAFLEWMRTLRFVALAEEVGLEPADLPDPRGSDGSDPRHWPDLGLQKLVTYWRREHTDGGRPPAAGRDVTVPGDGYSAHQAVWDGERELGHVHPDLDLDYVDCVAADLAAILQTDVAEACYQPGDGTCYRLVIVPLFCLRAARPRVKDGTAWERHAVSGVVGLDALDREGLDGEGYYGEGSYLLALSEGYAYPIRLRARGSDLVGAYVAEHWKLGQTSGTSVAILLRAVSHYLDKWDDLGAAKTARERRDRIRKENTDG